MYRIETHPKGWATQLIRGDTIIKNISRSGSNKQPIG